MPGLSVLYCAVTFNKPQKHPVVKKITPPKGRRLDIIRLLAKGLTSKEIAVVLFLAVSTINNYRHEMLRQYNVSSTQELVLLFKDDL